MQSWKPNIVISGFKFHVNIIIFHDSQVTLHCQEFFYDLHNVHVFTKDYSNTLDITQLVLTTFLFLSCQVLSHADDLVATLVHLLEYVKHLTHPRGITSQLCDLRGACVHTVDVDF